MRRGSSGTRTAISALKTNAQRTEEEKGQGTDPNAIRDGLTLISGGNTVQVVSAAGRTVIITKTPNKKSVTIPATVNVKGINCKVVGIKSGIFRKTKIRTITIKSKTLIKKRVKGCLKGSKVKKIKVKVGKKKVNKKFVKKYKKFFTKKNACRKVKVK